MSASPHQPCCTSSVVRLAELRLYAGQLAQAQVEWQYGDPDRAMQILDGCQWDLRHVEFRHLWTLYTSNQKTLRGHTGGVNSVAYSPDGTRLLTYRAEDGHDFVWMADPYLGVLSRRAKVDGGEGGAINFQKIPAGVYGHNDLQKGLYILLRSMGIGAASAGSECVFCLFVCLCLNVCAASAAGGAVGE